MGTPAEGLARLRAAADSGVLDELCERYSIRVLTVFGSTARGEARARDLDIGVLIEPGVAFDLFMLVAELMELAGLDEVDVAHLNRGGPVIKERALVGSIALYERAPGALASAQIAAMGERVETDANRRLNLRLMAQ